MRSTFWAGCWLTLIFRSQLSTNVPQARTDASYAGTNESYAGTDEACTGTNESYAGTTDPTPVPMNST
jgi:hypothetical protein